MINVVSGPAGTAHQASLDSVEVAGKTGTAQWGPKNKERTAAWFAGFVPAERPQLRVRRGLRRRCRRRCARRIACRADDRDDFQGRLQTRKRTEASGGARLSRGGTPIRRAEPVEEEEVERSDGKRAGLTAAAAGNLPAAPSCL